MSGKIFLAFLIFATIFHQSNGCWSFGGTSTTTTATSSTTAKPSTEPSTTSSVITTSTTISSSTTTITTTSTTPTTTSKYLTIPNYQHIIIPKQKNISPSGLVMFRACNYRASGGPGLTFSGLGSGRAFLHRASGFFSGFSKV